MNQLAKNKLSAYELSFLVLVVGLHIQAGVSVFLSTPLKSVSFYVLLVATTLLFIQYTMRYVGIVHKYNSESTLVAWVVSLLVFISSYVLVHQIGSTTHWFLCFVIVSGSAVLKDIQCISALPNNPYLPESQKLVLKETAIIETALSILFILFFVLSTTDAGVALGVNSKETVASIGAVVALVVITLFSTIIFYRAYLGIKTINRVIRENA